MEILHLNKSPSQIVLHEDLNLQLSIYKGSITRKNLLPAQQSIVIESVHSFKKIILQDYIEECACVGAVKNGLAVACIHGLALVQNINILSESR